MSNDGPGQRALVNRILRLDPQALSVLESLLDAFDLPVEERIARDSDILDEPSARHFRFRLQLHTVTTREKFKKKSFESAFQEASKASGKDATITDSATHPGHDVTVDGMRFSLKTEAAKNIRANAITISKFMEARWIRECRTGSDFRQGCNAIIRHLSHYDRILTSRAFDVGTDYVRYELVEIPRELLDAIGDLAPKDFYRRTGSGGTRAVVRVAGEDAFTLRLDGSVEKVTISGLRLDLCKSHARWVVPLIAPG